MEVRRSKAPLWSLVLLPLLAVFGVSLSGCAWERPEDPVVVTGAEVPRLVGVPPSEVIAYRWLNDRWEQLPVQVDERALIDLNNVYNQAPNGSVS